ncbi:MAG: helix-turn-helix domain-containing protein [Rhodobacteraceae bacterium]|nr:helix-turn-helix domain-containing protein [Paracoccaceae bacterium]
MKQLGLTSDMAENPDVFVHSEVFYGLMNELARAAQDPFLGLHVAEEIGLDEWPVLTASLESSHTVGEFLIRFVQNVPKHYTSAEHALLVGADRSQYRFKRVRQPANSAAQLDGFAAGLYLRIFEAAASKAWVPEEITLRTAYPEAIPSFYREATIETHSDAAFIIEFPTEILFEGIAFDATVLQSSPAWETRPSLVSAARAIAIPLLSQEGDLSQAIADALGVSMNLMEKTLTGEGTSLNREIKTLKCEVSCELLADTNTPIADVGAQIGYSEPANFTRFFKSQLGMTPNQYRKANRHENDAR